MIKQSSVIQTSKEILGAEPVFRGTRVPIRALIDYLEAGDKLDDFIKDFPTAATEQAIAVLEIVKRPRTLKIVLQ